MCYKKLDDKEMLEEISEYLTGYLKSGKININSFFEKIHLNVENLNQLLLIRFLISEKVMYFIEELPNRMNEIKTTTEFISEVNHSKIDGDIDWIETYKTRINSGLKENILYVTNSNQQTFNTIENKVFKEVITIIYSIVFKNKMIEDIFDKNDWAAQWGKLKPIVHYFYSNNIYIQRIKYSRITDREIEDVLKSRKILYRESAEILKFYRKLIKHEFNKQDVKKLIGETMIIPENKDVLLELYCCIQELKKQGEDIKLSLLLPNNSSPMAIWKDRHYCYELYHNASTEKINFRIHIDEIKDSHHPLLQRLLKLQVMQQEESLKYFQTKQSKYIWMGRPDILITKRDNSGKLQMVTIGEVKNTLNDDYARAGMNELLTYMVLAKDEKGNYLESTTNVVGVLYTPKNRLIVNL